MEERKIVESWDAHKAAIQAIIKLPSGELVTDTVRGLANMHGLGILSASHDGSIRLWALTGQVLMEMVGHASIVYSVDSHVSGLIVSGSEDCSAKIWKDGVCVQSIEHPGCVWDVKFLENGDIVTACSDGVVRIWTSDQEMIADLVDLDSYVSELSHYKLSRKRVGGLKLEDLPGLDTLQISGTSDGQTKIIREGDNGVAYAWNLREQKWDKIVEFILQNNGQGGAALDSSFHDPFTGLVLAKPIFKHIPKKGMLVFDVAQFEGILKKLTEFNNSLLSDSDKKNLSLSELEISRLSAVIKILKDTSHYHTSKFADADIALLLKLLKSWPLAMIFPVIDILRMLVLHPDGVTVLLKHVVDENDTLMEMIKRVAINPPLPPNLLTVTLVVTNLFKNSRCHYWLQKHRSEILDAFSSCYSSPNKNLQLSYATMILKKDHEGQSQVLSAALEIVVVVQRHGPELNVGCGLRTSSSGLQVSFCWISGRDLQMLDGLVKRIALDFDVENVAKTAKASKEAKIAEVGADIESLTK
ncbi:hypothetical protein SADUNF_Sadunf04G0107000 [Salix dunnii]|uniref:PUL domain-containing protein n=1 Tax=Salix dunnii TaxID=1413687 RepID=A0A835KFM5_9ROSI|nr:hypothetical protein SADUNF_Sadunf04G0107000 [Salix dunnii]